ncbi:MAG: N-acetylmuramoyl-L-alanine amidase [Candidatus Sericytochromatia bacterium]|nr:N-acetylmuramoyl-L-alanine amidase [Candidatus Sericytochromatia bacterium]
MLPFSRLTTVGLALTLAGCGMGAGSSLRVKGLAVRASGYVEAVPAPGLVDMPSPNMNDRPEQVRPDCVVWHHTASRASARQTGRYFQNPEAQVSSHYIVDRSGEIVRSVADDRRSWHAGPSAYQGRNNVNDFSIGIEICNLGDNGEAYSAAQVAAVAQLTAWLIETHGMGRERITRHRDIAVPAGRKTDTSDNFPYVEALEQVAGYLDGKIQPVPVPPPTSVDLTPDRGFRTVVVPPGLATWEDLADAMLDSPFRADELRLLNPAWSAPHAGLPVRIPTDYRHFDRLHPGGQLIPLFR